MIKHDLVFDALIRPRHLEALAKFATEHLSLEIVVDHAAKPAISRQQRKGWTKEIADLAHYTNASCKISGMMTEAGNRCRSEDLNFYMQHLPWCLGPNRLVWGSAWPVLRNAGDYTGRRNISERTFHDLCEADTSAILGGNAARIYKPTSAVGYRRDQFG